MMKRTRIIPRCTCQLWRSSGMVRWEMCWFHRQQLAVVIDTIPTKEEVELAAEVQEAVD